MARHKAKFTANDIKRAVTGAASAGLTIFGVNITPEGVISIQTASGPAHNDVEGPRRDFEEWQAKRRSNRT